MYYPIIIRTGPSFVYTPMSEVIDVGPLWFLVPDLEPCHVGDGYTSIKAAWDFGVRAVANRGWDARVVVLNDAGRRVKVPKKEKLFRVTHHVMATDQRRAVNAACSGMYDPVEITEV